HPHERRDADQQFSALADCLCRDLGDRYAVARFPPPPPAGGDRGLSETRSPVRRSQAATCVDSLVPLTRVVSGAVLLVGVLAAVCYPPPIYLLAVAVAVALLAFREYADIAERAGAHVSRPAAGMATALVCVAVAVPGLPVEVVLAAVTLGLLAVVLARATIGGERGE